MQIVIDIPEEMYTQIIDENGIETMLIPYKDIIKNGTPLPKGHGALKDIDKLRQNIVFHKYSDTFCEEHNIDWSISLGMVGIIIDNAPTLIEADKETEE